MQKMNDESVYISHTKFNYELLRSLSDEELSRLVLVVEEKSIHSHPEYIRMRDEYRRLKAGIIDTHFEVDRLEYHNPRSKRSLTDGLQKIKRDIYNLVLDDHDPYN